VIDIENVTKRFQSLEAISNVTLHLEQGSVLGILGPNGAGKTTLFRLIAGFLQPDEGRLRVSGPGWPAIGYKPERLLFPGNMRVGGYMNLAALLGNLRGEEAKRAVDESLSRFQLQHAFNMRIKQCSKGMRQRLALAQSTIGNPSLLLFDEPSNGLDPEGQFSICRQIKQLHAEGKTIVLASHQLQEVTEVCTHLVILNRGEIRYERPMVEALAEKPHAKIQVDEELMPLEPLLLSLHEGIEIHGTEIILNNGARSMRRQILNILLGAGYDVIRVSEQHTTLEEIYEQTIR
jgi:ABC-type multidrug transport system ATPase subunit